MRLVYLCRDRNFGDELNVPIVSAMANGKISSFNIVEHRFRLPSREPSLLAIGSILHFVQPGDYIWGTGLNPSRLPTGLLGKVASRWRFQNLHVAAVRGPMTKKYLEDAFRLDIPAIFADPALLLPSLRPDLQRNPVRLYGVVPHHRDVHLFKDHPHISPLSPWEDVVRYILGCEVVCASSLHGIIVAEAFGVKARWLHAPSLPSFATEGHFKYEDYYASTGRLQPSRFESVESALASNEDVPDVSGQLGPLRAAFPRF